MAHARKQIGSLFLLAAIYAGHGMNVPAGTHAPATAVGVGGVGRARGALPGVSQELTTLAPGQDFEREMRGGGKHLYKITLGASQYLRVVVEQHGIILSVTLSDAEGNEIVRADNPAGARGPVYVSAISESGGDYRLEVQAKESWANAGRYRVRVEELREATAADRGRVSAEKSFAAGRRLQEDRKATPDTRRQALKHFEEALSYWRQVGDRHWTALTEFCIAVTHRDLGELQAAEQHFGASLAVQLDEYDWRLRAITLHDMGANYIRMRDHERALKLLDEALRMYQSRGDRRGQASAFNSIGVAHLSSGRPREADSYFRKALPLRQAENDRGGEASARNYLGAAADRLGEPFAALENYGKALEIWRELDRRGELSNPGLLATGFNNVALAYDRLGDWQLAIDNYEKALELFSETSAVNAAKTLDNLGELHVVLGDRRAAKDYYDRALSLSQGRDPQTEANVLNHVGEFYLSEGEPDKALGYFERALALRKAGPEKAAVHTNIGAVYAVKGEPRKALASYGVALKLTEGSEDRRGTAAALHKTGEAHVLLGEHDRALETFGRALPLWRAVADRRGEAATLQGSALAERGRGNLAAALRHSQESLGIIESLRTKVASHRLRTSYFASQQNHYELYVDLRMRLYQLDKSPEHLAAMLEASELARARSLLDTLQESGANITGGVDRELAAREHAAQQRVNQKARVQMEVLNRRHTPEEAASAEREVAEAIAEYDRVRDRIRGSSPAYAQLTQPRSLRLSEVARLLDDDTILLEYLLGEEASYLLLVSNDSAIAAELLPKRSEIDGAATEFNKLLAAAPPVEGGTRAERRRQAAAEASRRSLADALSRMLLGRVADRLGKKRLLIVRDGTLQYLPFEALPAPAARREVAPGRAARAEGARYLVEDHEIVYLPSASVLAALRKEAEGRGPGSLSVAVLADPVVSANDPRLKESQKVAPDGGSAAGPPARLTRGAARTLRGLQLSRLPATETEARAIHEAVGPGRVMIATGLDANRATVMRLQDGGYRVVHFATHGVLNTEHPELSGLVLSLRDAAGAEQDGVLRLHDIYNLKLPADLVVLSACSTALGRLVRGEGLVGLTRGFMYAGAPRVVASLWLVEDRGTAELMKRFYGHMAGGRPPAAALRQAQIEMLTGRRWKSPYYWAGFVLQGEWRGSHAAHAGR